jgi:hypothetical protein
MASSINALTTGSGGVITTADNSGDLNIQSGGTTKIAVTSAGVAVTGLSKASLPTGSVLQVVNVAYSTNASTTSTSFVTTGINASITPTSATSKILVIFSVNTVNPAGTLSTIITVFRGNTSGTNLSSAGNFGEAYASSGNIQVSICGSALDSPATTSATNYQVCFKVNGGTGQINGNAGNTSTITLMEIAA